MISDSAHSAQSVILVKPAALVSASTGALMIDDDAARPITRIQARAFDLFIIIYM